MACAHARDLLRPPRQLFWCGPTQPNPSTIAVDLPLVLSHAQDLTTHESPPHAILHFPYCPLVFVKSPVCPSLKLHSAACLGASFFRECPLLCKTKPRFSLSLSLCLSFFHCFHLSLRFVDRTAHCSPSMTMMTPAPLDVRTNFSSTFPLSFSIEFRFGSLFLID